MASLGITATWGRQEWGNFLLRHLAEQSALLRAGARFIPIGGRILHLPRTLSDGTASWTAELAEIASDAPTGDELVLQPKKVANVVVLSNESIADAPVDELDAVGVAMARSVANSIDAKALSDDAATAVAPAGLLTAAVLPQTGGVDDIDSYLSALGAIEAVGATGPYVIFMNPADKTALTLVKEATGSERPLLQPDPTQAGAYTIGGARIISTSAMGAGTALVAEARQIVVGVRKDIEVAFSGDSRFTADAVVARVVARFDWGFNDPRGARLVTT
jgi:HK97 family phage major capsid protein